MQTAAGRATAARGPDRRLLQRCSTEHDEIVHPAKMAPTKMAVLSRVLAPASRSQRMKGERFESSRSQPYRQNTSSETYGGDELLMLGGMWT
jgi:hypothetical protein